MNILFIKGIAGEEKVELNAKSCSDYVEDSIYPMNTLKISFPYSYAIETASLNWYDIGLAIRHGFMTYDAAMMHAQKELDVNQDATNDILELALLSYENDVFEHSIHPYIDSLAEHVTESERNRAKDKIMYILLNWVYDHRTEYTDPLEVVEFIYDDFEFPKSIRSFVKYLPMKGANLGSQESNVNRLFEYWRSFLKEQKELWKK